MTFVALIIALALFDYTPLFVATPVVLRDPLIWTFFCRLYRLLYQSRRVSFEAKDCLRSLILFLMTVEIRRSHKGLH